MAYKVSSGYTFCSKRDSKLPVDGLLVGKATVFQAVSKALIGFTAKEVSVKVVRGYTYVYPLQPKKLTQIVIAIKTVVR